MRAQLISVVYRFPDCRDGDSCQGECSSSGTISSLAVRKIVIIRQMASKLEGVLIGKQRASS